MGRSWSAQAAWQAAGLPASLVSVRQAAELVHVTVDSVRIWHAKGLIKFYTLPGGARYLVDLAEIIRVLTPNTRSAGNNARADAQRARWARVRAAKAQSTDVPPSNPFTTI